MNEIEKERNNNRKLYRELFANAQQSFKKQLDMLKNPDFCTNCSQCCKIRYSAYSPKDINNLIIQNDNTSKEYANLFLPYGAGENFNYCNNNIVDIEANNNEAKQANNDYVQKIISKSSEPVYFYYCKFMDKNNQCTSGHLKSFLCKNFPSSVTTILPNNCGFKNWQAQSITKIKEEIFKDIATKIAEIKQYGSTFNCKNCATCCNLASSEFSYEELKQKASNGDNFATQFTSVFIPYENIEEAREIYPDFVNYVLSTLGEGENIYFYHCPKLTKDNLCSDYQNRPEICRSFPDNPLSILPPSCGFYEWKEEVMVASMLLHALIEISELTLNKLEDVI